MARTPTLLVGPQACATSSTSVHTVAASTKALVRHIHFSNPSGAAVTVTVQIDIAGSADNAAERIFDAYSVAAGAVLDHFCYYPIVAAGEIRVHSSAATTIVTITGDVINLS